MIPPIRALPDGEELVLAEDTPFNPLPSLEPDPQSAALKRRSDALHAPPPDRKPRPLERGAGV